MQTTTLCLRQVLGVCICKIYWQIKLIFLVFLPSLSDVWRQFVHISGSIRTISALQIKSLKLSQCFFLPSVKFFYGLIKYFNLISMLL